MKWREQAGVRWLEAELPNARAAFSARLGGLSDGPFRSLNLGLLTGDHRRAVRENRHRLAAAVGIDAARVLIGRQVHGAEMAVRDEVTPPGPYAEPGRVDPPQVDGQATAVPGLVPLVFVADCLPVALVGPGGVAMIHCGWRGLAAGLIDNGAAAVNATAAAIGPGIGPCCYEVGDEVLSAFADVDGAAQGERLDLAAVAKHKLRGAGVAQVNTAELCTSCNPDLFFSHRRDGRRTGRQAGLAWLA
jgi:purine-nucleoside/S-methyl-5'-thioadenosine phosphorylase / adenosine deaminase